MTQAPASVPAPIALAPSPPVLLTPLLVVALPMASVLPALAVPAPPMEVAVAVAVAVVALVAPVLAVAVIYPSPLFVEEQPQYLRAGATSQHALMERVNLSVTMSTLLPLVLLIWAKSIRVFIIDKHYVSVEIVQRRMFSLENLKYSLQ